MFNIVGNGKLSEKKFIKVHDYWHTITPPVFINILIFFLYCWKDISYQKLKVYPYISFCYRIIYCH